jgi:hypothetical protein
MYSKSDSIQAFPTAVDGNGNIIVAGSAYNPSTFNDYVVLKYDKNGNLLWTRFYDNPIVHGNDIVIALALDGYGNIFVTGQSNTAGNTNSFVTIKYDPNGNQQWIATFQGASYATIPASIKTDTQGNAYVTGTDYNTTTNIVTSKTIKYDPSGNQLWVNSYTGNGKNTAAFGSVITANGIFVTGLTLDSASYTGDATLQKIDLNSGSTVSMTLLNGFGVQGSSSQGNAITADASGNLYITGFTGNTLPNGAITQYFLTAKYTPSGSLVWFKTYDGLGQSATANALTLDDNNNLIITGAELNSNTFITEYHTVKYDNNGNQLWASIFSEGANLKNDQGIIFLNNHIVADSAGNSYICGEVVNSAGTGADMVTIKYSPSGTQLWDADYHGATGDGFAMDLFLDKGTLYVTGEVNQNGVDNITTIRYDQTPIVSQPNGSCISSQSLSTPYFQNHNVLNGPEAWYSFVALTPKERIVLQNNNLPCSINQISVFGGTCSNLTLLSSTTIAPSPLDTFLAVTVNVIPGNTYYVQINGNSSSSGCGNRGTKFDLSILDIGAAASCTAPLINCDLVTNGNFETVDNYPGCNFFISSVNPFPPSCWFDPGIAIGATPDYFNSCVPPCANGPSCAGVPNNAFTTPAISVYDHTPGRGGVGGYGGLIIRDHLNPTEPFDSHEYLEVALRAPLNAGTTYHVSMWVYLAPASSFGCNGLGIAFSTAPEIQGSLTDPISTYPLINDITNPPILTISGWTQIFGDYPALGGESYLTIGNFFSNRIGGTPSQMTRTQTNNPPGSQDLAYYFIDDVSVTSTLTATVDGSQSVCYGCPDGAAQLFASASNGTPGYTYSWTPLTGLVVPPGGMGFAVEACPPSTTIYNVTITDAIGCTANATATVTVLQPPSPVTINSSAPIPLCETNTTLTAFSSGPGVLTYSWNPSSGLNTTNGAVVVASPLTTTTYTVTVSNSFGCITTGTITVAVSTDPCCKTPTKTFNSNFNTLNLGYLTFLNDVVVIAPGVMMTVGNSFVINRSEIRLGAGASIVVASGQTLTVENQSHLYSCIDTWNGILLKGGAVNFNSNSWLEDALIGIEASLGGIYTINTGIFNRNLTDIQVDGIGGAYGGTILNSVLSCRNIPIYPAPTVAGLIPQLSTLPIINLPPPNSTIRSNIGILVNGVTTIQIGSPSGRGTGINYFDNMNYGIWLKQSGATVQNNRFQYISGRIASSLSGALNTGIAILGQVSTADPVYNITIGGAASGEPNMVTECLQGIALYGDYKTTNVLNNLISVIATNGPGIISATLTGATGIYINPGVSNTHSKTFITVSNNYVANHQTGIMQVRVTGTPNSTIIYDANTVTANASGSLGYCTHGIYLQDPANIGPTVSLTVSNNTITNTTNGITFLNVKSAASSYTCFSNKCLLRYKTGATLSQNGIEFLGCKMIQAHNNHVICDPAAAALGGNINVAGIYLQNSSTMYIHCNLVEQLGRGMVFEGNCLSTSNPGRVGAFSGSGISQNTMSQAQDGFVLKTNGLIGRQGSPPTISHPTGGVPSDNYWDMTTTAGFSHGTFNNWETFVINTTNAYNTSTLFNTGVHSGNQATFPDWNSGSPVADKYIPIGFPLAIGTLAACGPIPHSMSSTSADDSLFQVELQFIIVDTTSLPVFSDETHIIQRHDIYDILDDDATVCNGNNCLKKFYSDGRKGNYKKFKDVDDDISAGRYTDALKDNNSIYPQNSIELNQKNCNSLLLSLLLNPSAFDSVQLSSINSIAQMCPLQAGNSVYQARALLNLLNGQALEFPNNCDSSSQLGGHGMIHNSTSLNNKTKMVASSEFKVFPNPNDGNITVEYSLIEGGVGLLVIYDLEGNKLASYPLAENQNLMQLHTDTLSSGIYIYHYEQNGQCKKTGKLVIIK